MLLAVNLFAPLLGPLFVALLGRNRSVMGVLDGFVIVLLGGLLATHILPSSLELLGWPAVVAGLVGLALPKLLHHHDHAKPGRLVMAAALAALSLHALMDGTAMGGPSAGEGGDIEHDSLLVAVGLHRLLEGTGTWWLLGRYVAAPGRLLAMLALTALTFGGYLAGQAATTSGLSEAAALLQVAVAGSLAHVLLWHPAADHTACSLPQSQAPSAWVRSTSLFGGALAAVALVAFERMHDSGHGHGHGHGGGSPEALLAALPAVCTGALVALGCAVFAHALTAHAQLVPRGRTRLAQALWGALRGLFVPACSCGAVSLAAARRREGLPEPGVLAYLLAAPAMGWLGFLLSLVLLGPVMALLRGLGSVCLAACLAALLGPRPAAGAKKVGVQEAASIQGPQATEAALPRSLLGRAWLRLVDGFDFVGGEMLDFSAPWLTLGLGLTGLLLMHAPPQWLATAAASHGDVWLLAALALPVYLCAAAGTLVAWFLWHGGASMGAVLTFGWLVSSLSVASFGAQARWYGRGRATSLALLQAVSAVGLGAAINWLGEQVPMLQLAAWPPAYESKADGLSAWPFVAAASLLAVALWRQGLRGFVGQILWANGPQRASGHHAPPGAACAHRGT